MKSTLVATFLASIGVIPFADKWLVGVPILYGALSCAAFVYYAIDKFAARRQQQRVRESTLHVLALLGGWPGALLAQQLLRHKTSKRSFQRIFWITVGMNCAGIGCILALQYPYFAERMSQY